MIRMLTKHEDEFNKVSYFEWASQIVGLRVVDGEEVCGEFLAFWRTGPDHAEPLLEAARCEVQHRADFIRHISQLLPPISYNINCFQRHSMLFLQVKHQISNCSKELRFTIHSYARAAPLHVRVIHLVESWVRVV